MCEEGECDKLKVVWLNWGRDYYFGITLASKYYKIYKVFWRGKINYYCDGASGPRQSLRFN